MRVLVTTESRFERTPDGRCWTVGATGYAFWTRYLDVFDEVAILARLLDVEAPSTSAVRADGQHVSLAPLTHYLGPWQYLRRHRRVSRDARRAVRADDAVILRAPGVATVAVAAALEHDAHPFGVEVIGDPEDVFAPGSGVRTMFRALLRHTMSRDLRRQCSRACAVAYVTAGSLQRRYPPAPGATVTHYSSITMPDEAFVREPRALSPSVGIHRLVFVGSLEQMYKGQDVLVDAVASAANDGCIIDLTIIGDGQYRAAIERQAHERGIGDRVRFLGHLPSAAQVRAELDAADLFVLPSLTEGLPRALIEAMARGVPCVATAVGGIPELLAPSELVPRGDRQRLKETIVGVLGDPERRARLARENLARAREFHSDVLTPRRRTFYQAVRDATAEHLALRRAGCPI
jgi:glycosyltransferase involved in cell wall biosynthesis